MKVRTLLLSISLACTGATTGQAAPSKVSVYLAQAKAYLQGLEYERCLQRLAQAVPLGGTQQEQAEIELYSGLCKYNLGKKNAARRHFHDALALNPSLELPPLSSPRIVELFNSVRPPPAPPPANDE